MPYRHPVFLRGCMTDKIVQTDPVCPQPEILDKAAEKINNSGVVVFPTWCLYGLAADAFNHDAVKKIFTIKNRLPDNPLLILVKDKQQIEKLVKEIPVSAKKLIERFWPGRLTLVFNAADTIPEILTGGTGKIGIRLPEHPVAMALLNKLENPVTGTSANISGEPGCKKIEDMDLSIIENTDLTLDAGVLKGGTGSSIVDVTMIPPRIIREGEVPESVIQDCVNSNRS